MLQFEAFLDFAKHTAPTGVWIVEGYGATSDLDTQYDVISQEALEMGAQWLQKYTTVLFNHDADRPIGQIMESKALEGHLFIKVAISRTEPKIWEQIKDGTLSKFSIRGRVTDSIIKVDDLTKKEILVIKGMELHEVSLVSVPANVEARSLAWYIEKALEEQDIDKKNYRKPGESMADCVSRKTALNIKEGMPKNQAVAAAYSMCGEKKELDGYKEIVMSFVDSFKTFISKSTEKVDEVKGGEELEQTEEVIEKAEIKTEQPKPPTEKVVDPPELRPQDELPERKKADEQKVTLDVSALRDVITQLQTLAKDVTTQSETVKKSQEEVNKAKDEVTKMIADLNAVVKEIPIRKGQHAADEKVDERKEDKVEDFTKSDAYKNARKPTDRLSILLNHAQGLSK